MNFTPVGDMNLVYVGPGISYIDYGAGGQFYAHMEGTLEGPRLRGTLRLTNMAIKRPDDINMPTLRGVLETHDGVTCYVEMNGMAVARHGGREFVTSMTLRTNDPRYDWVNTQMMVAEGFLQGEPRPHALRATCRVYACEPTIADDSVGAAGKTP